MACGREAVIACVADGAICDISSGTWLDRNGTPGLLDTRVDRVLASIGWDAAQPSAFVLVAPTMPDDAALPRWTVVNREARAQ